MWSKVFTYVIGVLMVGYIFFDVTVTNLYVDQRLNEIRDKSIKSDSIINLYELKIDTLSMNQLKRFNQIDSNIISISSHLDIIENKTNIIVDSAAIEEALLWADSVSQYY